MRTLFDLLLISFIVVFIVDLSGVMDSIKSGLKKWMTKGKLSDSNYRLKPFDCSLCSTVWSCIIFLVVTGQFTLPYLAFTCVLAYLSDITRGFLLLVKDLLATVIQKLNDLTY